MAANPADEAAIEEAKFNAEMARRDAGHIMSEASQQAALFTAGAEQTLARGMTILAKTGNLGTTDSTAPTPSGIGVGSAESGEVQALRDKIAKDEASLEELGGAPDTGGDENANPSASTALMDQIAKEKRDLAILEESGTVKEIDAPTMLLRASGSDLSTMINLRDSMQRDVNTAMRSAQNDALTMLKNAGHYDQAAVFANRAAQYNTMNTILGYGFRTAGLAASF